MNNPIGIVLLIAGAFLLFICGSLYLSTLGSIKNQAAWDKFYEEAQKKLPQVSEDELYRLVCQLNTASCWGTVISLFILFGGILLLIV